MTLPVSKPSEELKGENWRAQYTHKASMDLLIETPETSSTQNGKYLKNIFFFMALSCIVYSLLHIIRNKLMPFISTVLSGDGASRPPITTTSTDIGPEVTADLEEVFSDISDDADDILNQDDVIYMTLILCDCFW